MLSKVIFIFAAIVLIIVAFVSPSSRLIGVNDNTVIDVSWPNCKTVTESDIGIIGINGGLSFHPNDCLYNESRSFNKYALYLNTGYPGPNYGKKFPDFPLQCNAQELLCFAYNYGYNSAQYSINYAFQQSVHAFMWWLDVENSNSWTDDGMQNRAELQGMVDAIKKYTFMPTIGYYSYPGQWNSITGSWRNGFPVWVATGTDSIKTAIAFCKNENFTGGDTWLTQYTTNLDHNYICNKSFNQYLIL